MAYLDKSPKLFEPGINTDDWSPAIELLLSLQRKTNPQTFHSVKYAKKKKRIEPDAPSVVLLRENSAIGPRHCLLQASFAVDTRH